MAHLIKEKLPETEVSEYYIDMRAFGKGYEEFYERIKEEGVNMIRGKTASIKEADGRLLLRSEDMESGRLIEQHADMVILAVGLEPGSDSQNMASILGIERDHNGWFLESNSIVDNVSTYSGGIYIAGACQGPKDIPDSVAQGSAAAAKVLQNLATGSVRAGMKEVSLEQVMSKINEITIAQEVSQ
jgi:heterodisulfide reductase subunit A